MKKIIIFFFALLLAAPSTAQKKTTKTPVKKTATTQKKTQKKTTQKKTTTKSKQKVSNNSIKGLQNQRSAVQQKIKQQEKALKANKADVAKRLQNLMIINSEISEKQKTIDGIQTEITGLDGDIKILQSQLQTLEQQLQERKDKYIKSAQYISKHRTVQDKLMFIFSAKNFAQMYRRLRFVRQYAAFQRAQGESIKAKQAEITSKHDQLNTVKGQKNNLLYQGKKEQSALQGKQSEQQQMVQNLQKQQKTIQGIIAQQKKKDAELNARIDKLIAEEVARQKRIAEAERKRKAQEAAEAKRKQEELARKKAEAERIARENEQRIAAAKEREAKLKAEAKAAADAEQKRLAEQRAKEAQANREAAERKAKVDADRNRKEIAVAKKKAEESASMSTADRMVSGGFEANKGRLPMPVTGSYKIVSHFGQYNVEGLKNVTLDNKGINILGSAGCRARSIYDGEVSAVFGYSGSMVVMVRHGAYISVYCNLSSVSVSKGQKVSTRQVLGTVGQDNILQFQLRRETAKLNPEQWLGR